MSEALAERDTNAATMSGEMMINLTESRRVRRGEEDSLESFSGGYDFKEAFLGPYQT